MLLLSELRYPRIMCFNFMFSMLDPLMLHLYQWIALNLLQIVGFYLLSSIVVMIREYGRQI